MAKDKKDKKTEAIKKASIIGDAKRVSVELKFTCALDASEAGQMTLEDIAFYYNVTRERVRRIEANALNRFKHRATLRDITCDEGANPTLHLKPFRSDW